MKILTTLTILVLGLIAASNVEAGIFGRRNVSCQQQQHHYYPVQQLQFYHQPLVIERQIVRVPSRITTYGEIKGLEIIEDLGTKYLLSNGKLVDLTPRETIIITEEVIH